MTFTIRAAVSACALFAAWAAPAPALAQTKLKLSHFLPPTHGIHLDFLAPWADEVEACANGEVEIEIFDGGTELGGADRQLDQVRSGAVEIAHGLTGAAAGSFPRTSLIELPFLAASADAATRALWAALPEHLAPDYAGLKVLALHAHNPGLVHTRETPLTGMADLKGLRIRAPSPIVGKTLEAFGAVPVEMRPDEVKGALLAGAIDGTVFPWDPVASYGLAEALNHHLDAGIYTTSFFFVMNQAAYDALPPAARACIDTASGDALVAKFGAWWDAWDAPGRDAAIAGGASIVELTPEQRGEARDALAPVIDATLTRLEAEGVPDARAIYEALQQAIAAAQTGRT